MFSLMLGPKRYRLPCDFTERTFMLFGRSREASVPCRLQIPLRHYAEIQWNPVSFRFIRDTLRTSLRSICLLRDCRLILHGTDSLQIWEIPSMGKWNVCQHVLDFSGNDTHNERFRYHQHSDRILSLSTGLSGLGSVIIRLALTRPFQKLSEFFMTELWAKIYYKLLSNSGWYCYFGETISLLKYLHILTVTR